MAYTYILRAADLPFPLKSLVNYSLNLLLSTQSNDVQKLKKFFIQSFLGHLLGLLGPADPYIPLNFGNIQFRTIQFVTATKSIAYNEKSVQLQVALCKCQYLTSLCPIILCNYPMMTSQRSCNPDFGAFECNLWIKPYLEMG